MAQFTGIAIDIDGKSIKQFSSITITRGIYAHHAFRLECPSTAIDDSSGAILNSSKNLIGGKLSVQIDAIGSTGTLQFVGMVTQVEASRHSGHAGDIVISGYSPTVIMDNGLHCKTWEKKAVKNIAQDVLKHFPQNLLQPKITPAYGDTISYAVQYKETAWQFLNRLSATYGEWLYYDGKKLVMAPPAGNMVKLIYGNNLPSFNMTLQVRPATFKMMAYDYMNNEVYDSTPAGTPSRAGLNDLGKHTFQKSEKFYGTEPKQWNNQFLTNKKQLDDFVNTRAAMQGSNMVHFTGSSGHPGIQVGGSVNVEGKNIFSNSEETFGEYTVISVSHHCDGQGNYGNNFVAIPASVKMPPVTNYAEPHCETQSALVTDNHDEKGLGRVRVKFHWMNGSEKSPWLRVTSPHGGGGKGMFFIPEVGEEVIVGFEGDSPVKPYIIGTVFHGKAKNENANSGNDVKAIQTRSGNKVVMNDKDGSVHVSDAKGNDMMMDGKGNINVKSSETMVFTCGKSKIEMKKDGTVNINGKAITVNGTDSINLNAPKINLKANQEVVMEGTGTGITAKGLKIELEATTDMKMKGLNTTAEGSVQLDLKGGVMASLSAAIVKIN